MKKMAEKLKKPGGEEKLRSKIEKYLKQVPEQFCEDDEDNLEFIKQLPNDIIRKLKKMYLNPTDANVNVYRLKLSKYCGRFKMNLRKTVLNWTKTLNFKKKDFLGRNVKKDDISKYVVDKLVPLVLDRPQSDSEYKATLKNVIAEIVDELPLELNSNNKEFYLNKVTEDLVNDILNIKNKYSSTHIQPTTEEIKEFVEDEITFFLKKCRVAMSTKRIKYLETELIDILLDLTDITDIDGYVVRDVTTLLKEVGKLPEYKAKYFTILLLNDYKEFFFRESFFQFKDNSDHGQPDVDSDFQNANGLVDFSEATSFEIYRQRLEEQINKWITKLNIPINDENFIETVVKDLAGDLVDRYKYLLLNPSTKGTNAEELNHLKFLIFKCTNKLVGIENTLVLKHAQELINEISNIPKPCIQSSRVDQSTSPQNTYKINDKKPCIDILTDQIYDWYCELHKDIIMSQDVKQNKLLIKDLAEEIEKGLKKKENEIIDREARKWTDKILNAKLSNHDVEQLKNRISNIPGTKDNMENDPNHAKTIIKSYEDIVDEWIETVPITPKKEGFLSKTKNKIVHDIANEIFNIKSKMSHLPDEIQEKKLQEELLHCLKELPLHEKVDNQNVKDNYVAKLVNSIQTHNTNDLEKQLMLTSKESMSKELDKVMIELLKKLPLYGNKNPEERIPRIKELANKLIRMVGDENACLDDIIIKQIKMLDPKQNDDFVQNTAYLLKLHLQKLGLLKDSHKQHNEDDKLVDTIDVWLNDLPLHVTDVDRFNNQKTNFIKSMKRLISSGSCNSVMKKEILIFMRTLPMNYTKKYDDRYLNEKVFKLIHSLTRVPVSDVPIQSSPKSNEFVFICNTIKEWTKTLPLKSVHCPTELLSFIEDMSSVITTLLLNPEKNLANQNDVRLHREIVKFLRRFPLIHELSTESHISRMAGELTKTLKKLFRNENSKFSKNVTVYDVSLGNVNTTDDFSIKSINESDVNENLETYTKQLAHQISEWFDRLNLPDMNKKGFKAVVINDLAGDIVDRHKYLELNPNSTCTEEDELEHLKYQIFKWINKLVGEETRVPIERADELMRNINKIPVPMLVRPQTKDRAESLSLSSSRQQQQINNNQTANSLIRKTDTEQHASFRESEDVQQATSGDIGIDTEQHASFRESEDVQQATSGDFGSSTNLTNPAITPCCFKDLPSAPPSPEEGTKGAFYEKYQKIFKERCNALPIDESTPDGAKLAELARSAIYNGIIRTFFNLKSDPEIENDYAYFEFMLEEKLDQLLDVLPQTEELLKKRHAWKSDIVKNAIDMLDHLHSLTDTPSFRQRVRHKFNRKFAIDYDLEHCFLLQQGFLAELADTYLLQTNYKEKDPMKANIYKNRLINKADELANHLSKEHNVGFRFFNKDQLQSLALKILDQVPIPSDEVLQEEVEEIQLVDEVEKWYKELPTQPLLSNTDGVLRKRMMNLLAKKLYDMHKRLDDEDPSKEMKMKHEMSLFLEKRAFLQEDQDLNINSMVDDLNNRLKNRWLKEEVNYDEFEKVKPMSSTLAQVDNADFLAPSTDDVATSTGPLQGQGYQEPVAQSLGGQEYFIQPGQPMQKMGQVDTSQGSGPCGRICSLLSGLDGSPARNTNGAYLEAGQFQLQGQITQQNPTVPNLSQQGKRVQCNGARQCPPLIRCTAPSPKNGREALHNQRGSSRLQNINQSLRQNGLTSQMGPQDHNLPSQVQGSYEPQRLSVPGPNQRQFSSDFLGNLGSRGPTPSHGAASTAQVQPDILDGDFKCRCLETYRRKMLFEYDEENDRFRPYRCPY